MKIKTLIIFMCMLLNQKLYCSSIRSLFRQETFINFSVILAITCWFIHCVYNEWSSWSGTCYKVQRTRSVRQEIRKSKTVVGDCAGLNILNCKPEIEKKDLGVCLRKLY